MLSVRGTARLLDRCPVDPRGVVTLVSHAIVTAEIEHVARVLGDPRLPSIGLGFSDARTDRDKPSRCCGTVDSCSRSPRSITPVRGRRRRGTRRWPAPIRGWASWSRQLRPLHSGCTTVSAGRLIATFMALQADQDFNAYGIKIRDLPLHRVDQQAGRRVVLERMHGSGELTTSAC